jgi:serine/threonine protein kinase/Flp pilus assembly protein TadD
VARSRPSRPSRLVTENQGAYTEPVGSISLAGRTIGRYRIVERLGEGGMGVVYRAQDTTLGRDVAIKVLRPELGRQPERVRRFSQEARAASALNHPNIITVHDAGEFEDGPFLVMELVVGESLRGQLRRGALPLPKVLDIGIQAAAALTRAHESGITHRDLKPENILLRPDGYVKILDFGLAKLTEREPPAENASATTTVEATLTSEGTVVGTAAYMSPEQATGCAVDSRSDIFSLALLLFECWQGHHPFRRKNLVDTMHAIAHDSLQAVAYRAGSVEWGLARMLEKALEKEPEERYQTMKDLGVDLRRLKQESESGKLPLTTTGVPARATGRPLVYAVAGLVVLALLALSVAYFYFHRPGPLFARSPTVPIRSLAVLPLENLSRDPEQEYFADGMTDELITQLAQISALRVISRTSVMRFKGTREAIRDITRELNVDAVVEGTVVRSAERVRVTAQVIQVNPEKHVWADSYDRPLGDAVILQGQLAHQIAQAIRIKLTPEEQTRLAGLHAVNHEAYETFLKGRYFWSKRTEETTKKAIEYFQQATEKDPNYALAFTGLADSYISLVLTEALQEALPPKEAFPKARAAVDRALEIDDTLAEAHASLGHIKFQYDRDWSGAEKEFQRAIELNPNIANAHQWYALSLMWRGRLEEALNQVKQALELDPLSLVINANLGFILSGAQQYDQAIEQFRKTLEMDPNFAYAHYRLGQLYVQKEMYAEAVPELEKAIALSGGSPRATAELGLSYARMGRRNDALRLLHDLKERSKRRYVSPFDLAVIYGGLGDKGGTLECLEKAYDERSTSLNLLKSSPAFVAVRSDPRFTQLVRHIGLPP